jgi:hypothetical protein
MICFVLIIEHNNGCRRVWAFETHRAAEKFAAEIARDLWLKYERGDEPPEGAGMLEYLRDQGEDFRLYRCVAGHKSVGWALDCFADPPTEEAAE